MIVLDSTFVVLFLDPKAPVPPEIGTGRKVDRLDERIGYLIENWSKAKVVVGIPTPVLAEVLTVAGSAAAGHILPMLEAAHTFRILPYDIRAAVETAMLAQRDQGKPMPRGYTKAKVKFDRQILATAIANGADTLYTDDLKLAARARAEGLKVVSVADLPLRPEEPQLGIQFPATAAVDEPAASSEPAPAAGAPD